MASPSITIRRGTDADAEFLDRGLRTYSSEIAAFSDGVDATRGLEPAWLTDERLHPFVIEVEGQSAGLAMAFGREYAATQNEDVDYLMYDFWIGAEHRGSGAARRGAQLVFDTLRGSWAIPVLPANSRAMDFWRAVIADRGCETSTAPGHEGLETFRFRT